MAKFYTFPQPIICECGWFAPYNIKPKEQDYHTITCTNHKCKNHGKTFKVELQLISTKEINEF